MAAVLHGLLLLLPVHLIMTGEPDPFLEPIVTITLTPELPVPSPLTHHEPPLAEPLPRPPPPVPEKEEQEKAENTRQNPPLTRPGILKHPPEKKSKTQVDRPTIPARADITPRLQPAAPDAAAAPAQPEMIEKQPKEAPVNRPPSVIHRPPPEYPQRARRKEWEGIAIVEALVDTSGMVHETRLAKTSGHESLDRAALDGVKNWRFQPGRKDGKNVSMWVHIPIRFQLE